VTAVDGSGLEGVDAHGQVVELPRSFVEGRRADGAPNCSHAWARTIEGIQGGTWTQAHLLGTAALERFTGYVGQSRSRQPTHTWNVSRVPEIDFGGVLADQRHPERVVLDALRRMPDTQFATHDRPRTKEELLAERAEHKAILATRPPDRSADLRQAQQRLWYAERNLESAHYRLHTAKGRLDRLGPLSQLRPQGRRDKDRALDDIDRFATDVTKAEKGVTERQTQVSRLQDEIIERRNWIEEHSWRDGRLRTIERELADVHCYIPLLDLSIDLGLPDHESNRRPRWERARTLDALFSRSDPGDVARPPLPGHDAGLGMDVGP